MLLEIQHTTALVLPNKQTNKQTKQKELYIT